MNPIMTIGYEGITAQQLVEALKTARVDVLLDVRIRAGSRKKGLSKSPLSQSLARVGIEYIHDRDLGTPREIMQQFRETGFYDWIKYVKFLKTKTFSIGLAASLTHKKRVCLLCFESNASECHRRFVAEEIWKESGSPIVHLRVMD